MGDRIAHAPDDTTFKLAAHLAHRFNSGTFGKFDFKLTNLVHYGTLSPPKYDLSKMTSPNMIYISANNDPLANQKDIDKMRHELKGRVH